MSSFEYHVNVTIFFNVMLVSLKVPSGTCGKKKQKLFYY